MKWHILCNWGLSEFIFLFWNSLDTDSFAQFVVLNFATLLYESKTLQNTMIKYQSNIKMPRTDIDFILSPNKVKSFVKFLCKGLIKVPKESPANWLLIYLSVRFPSKLAFRGCLQTLIQKGFHDILRILYFLPLSAQCQNFFFIPV